MSGAFVQQNVSLFDHLSWFEVGPGFDSWDICSLLSFNQDSAWITFSTRQKSSGAIAWEYCLRQ